MDDCLRDQAFIFPDDLSDFTAIESLGGGTHSTYRLINPATFQSLVIKHGAHLDAICIEILCNAAYRSLGVRVPNIKIYDAVSLKIAKSLDLAGMNGIFQVSEYIDPNRYANPSVIIEVAKKDFMVHVLLGNIDVAKEDNYVVSKETGDVYLVDAGANFVFRAKGEYRHEEKLLVSEISSLRDEMMNATAHSWFAQLSEEEIAAQVVDIAKRRLILEKYIWAVAEALPLSDQLCNLFIDCIADRLDYLIARYCPSQQPFAKIDKKAHVQRTAAGIFTYTYLNDQPHVLLAKRAKHEWWSNFGGKSDHMDTYLYDTAIREVSEESSYLLEYSPYELMNCPSHDLISEKTNGETFVYRMYLTYHHYVKPTEFTDHEHTAYQWVPLSSLLHALYHGAHELHENEDTISFAITTCSHPIKR